MIKCHGCGANLEVNDVNMKKDKPLCSRCSKEKSRENTKEWVENNREKYNSYHREWRKKNREEYNEYQRDWRKENKEKWKKIHTNSRASNAPKNTGDKELN